MHDVHQSPYPFPKTTNNEVLLLRSPLDMLPLAGVSVPKILIESAAQRGALGSIWFGAVSVLKKNRCCHK